MDFNEALRDILAAHQEYHQDAYRYLYYAANPAAYAEQNTDTPSGNQHKNLNAREFYITFCEILLREYGPMARTIVRYWGLHTTLDIGRATYYLITAGVLSKKKHESLEDFEHLPSLDATLLAPYEPTSLS